MIDFETTVSSPAYQSYRAARVRSLFNVSDEQGASHTVKVSLPIDEKDWQIGAVVGGSGTGKSTLGGLLLGGGKVHQGFEWDRSLPIIDQIGGEGADFNAVTGALSSVGLGTVPSWLRPFHVLSMGEQFRAEMARIVIDAPPEIVIDEFTSVVDRQIAQIGAAAFAKAWRRTGGKAIVLSCHKDFLEWLTPDWILDTDYWEFTWGFLRRPDIPLDVYSTSSTQAWRFFKPHHYLDLPNPIAATYYIAESNGTPVAHLAVATTAGLKSARLTRLVVLPEWQGAGVGIKFLEYVAALWLKGENRYSKPMTGIIHTSHPGLIIALNRSPRWVLVSQQMGGQNRGKSVASLAASAKRGRFASKQTSATKGYGGHLRAIAAFRYVGNRP